MPPAEIDYPAAARANQQRSAQVARRTATRARGALGRGLTAVVREVWTGQIAQAGRAEIYVEDALREQGIGFDVDAELNLLAFTTAADNLAAMLTETDQFDRLVESLVQDAGRAAEQVATAARSSSVALGHVRILTPPSCSRCVVLAGRVYRWSEGFERHPGDDCVSMPTTLVNPDLVVDDPLELLEQGLISDLSKADAQALRDGADLGKVVNVRRQAAGLLQSGRALARGGRLTPEGVYQAAGDDRDRALALLEANGYVIRRQVVSAAAPPAPELDLDRDRIEIREREPAEMTDEQLEAELAELMAAEDYGDRLEAVGAELDRRQAPPQVEVPDAPDPIAEQEALNRLLYGGTEARDLTAERRRGRVDTEAEIRDEYETWVHTQWLRAEEECRGILLSRQAEAEGRNVLDLFTGKLSLKWASEELSRWFAEPGNQRMSFPEFRSGRANDKKAREAGKRLRNRGFESEFG